MASANKMKSTKSSSSSAASNKKKNLASTKDSSSSIKKKKNKASSTPSVTITSQIKTPSSGKGGGTSYHASSLHSSPVKVMKSSSSSPVKKGGSPSPLVATSTKQQLTTCPHIDLKANPKLLENALRIIQRPSPEGCVYCGLDFFTQFMDKSSSSSSSSQPAVMYTCLECGDVSGCWHDGFFHLAAGHQGPNQSGHYLSAVTGAGPFGIVLYCSRCHQHQWMTSWQYLTDHYKHVRKDKLIKQVTNIHHSSPRPSDLNNITSKKEINRHCCQIRGLINLGQTCFMNCVLQVLVHDPHLQKHFLNATQAHVELHSKSQEENITTTDVTTIKEETTTTNKKSPEDNNNTDTCMACEMDQFFQDMYSIPPSNVTTIKGKSASSAVATTTAFAPVRLFTCLWRICKGGLVGYAQQDSHEFLISLLQLLHAKLADRSFGCDCLVHSVFSGVLESSVTCGHCGAVNAVYDPFLDISLQVPPQCTSVLQCFDHFVRPESFSNYACGMCHTSSDAIKQLRLRKLPKTLILHMKRFTSQGAKITDSLDVPVRFSVFPFTVNTPGSPLVAYRNRYAYHLNAIIAHWGTSIDSGHYTTYLAGPDGSDLWYAVNDDRVSLADLQTEVLRAPAYLLFYNRLADDHDNPLV